MFRLAISTVALGLVVFIPMFPPVVNILPIVFALNVANKPFVINKEFVVRFVHTKLDKVAPVALKLLALKLTPTKLLIVAVELYKLDDEIEVPTSVPDDNVETTRLDIDEATTNKFDADIFVATMLSIVELTAFNVPVVKPELILAVPFTSSVKMGLFVPMPTLPNGTFDSVACNIRALFVPPTIVLLYTYELKSLEHIENVPCVIVDDSYSDCITALSLLERKLTRPFSTSNIWDGLVVPTPTLPPVVNKLPNVFELKIALKTSDTNRLLVVKPVFKIIEELVMFV